MTHPLTDRIIKNNIATISLYASDDFVKRYKRDVRAAYDLGESKGRADMLEQVIEWLSYNLGIFEMEDERYIYIKEDFLSNTCIDEDKVIEDLKEAMLSQQQENNS